MRILAALLLLVCCAGEASAHASLIFAEPRDGTAHREVRGVIDVQLIDLADRRGSDPDEVFDTIDRVIRPRWNDCESIGIHNVDLQIQITRRSI